MEKKKIRGLDRETSMLGHGIMRLVTAEDGTVNMQESIDLIRYGIDHGITYIDTAYTYHGGRSEMIVGKALKDGYREKVILADKMPIWLAKTEEDLERFFSKQLQRLDVEYIDMYLIHNIIKPNWRKTQKLNVLSFLEQKKAEGKIGNIGFSFHGDLELFREVIDAFPWGFCQIQLNFLDKDIQAGLKGLEYAREHGVDVIVMEPLKGGRVTDRIPPTVQKLWDEAKEKGIIEADRTPAKTAFKWVASQPGVVQILSGMNSKEQIDENIAIFSDAELFSISREESELIDKVAAEYNRLIKYQCTRCEYCLPCEKKLNIPGIIEYLNSWYAFEKNPSTATEYINWTAPGHHASDCIGCGKCEENCPQSLPIIQIMKEAAEEFGQ